MSLYDYGRHDREWQLFICELEEHIIERKIKCFEEICPVDQMDLIGMLINALKGHGKGEWFYECRGFDDSIDAISVFLRRPNELSQQTIIDIIKKNAITYFQDQIDELIQDLASHNDDDWERYTNVNN